MSGKNIPKQEKGKKHVIKYGQDDTNSAKMFL